LGVGTTLPDPIVGLRIGTPEGEGEGDGRVREGKREGKE